MIVDHDRSLDVDDLRIIDGHVDDLRIGWLDPDDPALLYVDLLVIIDQHPLGIGLGPDPLDRIVDFFFLEKHGLAQVRGPCDVLGQHPDHVRELHEGDDGGIPIENCLGRRLLDVGILQQKLVRLDHVERAGGGREDLRQQFIRIECDRGHHLLQFLHGTPEVGGFVGVRRRHENVPDLGGGGWRRCGRRELGLGAGRDQEAG
jgi:hypothetical protein